MTHYEDLSLYEYFRDSIPEGVRALNVGWIEKGDEYVKGSVSIPFLQNLGVLVRDARQARTRGWKSCPLPHERGGLEYPVAVDIFGSKVLLGGAEIRVVTGSGEWLIAPDLIYHYVADHSYKPPEEFIEAVMARPDCSSDESSRVAYPSD
ncbi:hypothetical protein ACFTZF_47125 [Streptomyces mirabilis]|uniref:DUF7919 family protein n=1 Tax=Streptomyces mirabilis TaxID=68239 RepID=UPI003636CA9B